MLFFIFKICLQQLFPESVSTPFQEQQQLITFKDDLSGLFEIEVPSRRQRQQQRRQMRQQQNNSPYSINQRRLGRDFDRAYYQSRIRRHRQQNRRGFELPMTEMTSLPRAVRFHLAPIDNNENQVITEDSSERLSTQGNDSLTSIDDDILRLQQQQQIHQRQRDQYRLRRDFIRNEILRILTQPGEFERSRSSSTHNAFILRNLQFLQMSSMARDFNENDYEMLSQLDNSNFTRLSSMKIHLLISQLPTYQFKAKKNNIDEQMKPQISNINKTTQDKSMDFDHDNENCKNKQEQKDQIENQDINQNSYFSRDTCTICIETFIEDETIKILPCFHQFHSQCIDDWLMRKTLCPVCKFDIKTAAHNERQLSQQQLVQS